MNDGRNITQLLVDWNAGDVSAGETLMPMVYDELHRRSANLFRGEKPEHTLQPTALINEAFVRLFNADIALNDRAHFFAMASRMMRRVLLDHAKSRGAQKRGGDQIKVTYIEANISGESYNPELLDLTRALEDLATANTRIAEIVDFHYFGGLTVEEISKVTGSSTATIGRDLRFARAWLAEALGPRGDLDKK